MLETLRGIIQDVNAARNLDQALSVIVERVKQALSATVCSVYLYDNESAELVLMASDGLLRESVGRVRMSFDQGLVGLVAQKAEPVNLDNAPEHPRYQYFPETGEEKYHAFLGVPIIHQRQVLGVLVLQQSSAHRYNEDALTFMVTIAAQLAGAIAHAKVIGDIDNLRKKTSVFGQLLKGVPGAPGVAIGTAFVIDSNGDINAIPDMQVDDV
ncbi:MAG: GAF domain-containing protein, partial [Gammaproteobacteria bacterium]|nr:GAF domain-containing protein [Gammaproteobacteria bacterium]